LYHYQEEISDEISEFSIDNDLEIILKNCKLITKGNSVYLTSPLGSGKTRMAVRSIEKILKSSSFEEKNHFFRIKDQTSIIKDTCKSKIFIIVPVSIIEQWKKELDLWVIPYYTITMPRHFIPLEEIIQSVILMTDFRTKDIDSYFRLRNKGGPTKFINSDFQIYLFIDEFDTIKIHHSFLKNIEYMIKTKVCISAFYNGTDFYPVNLTEVNIKQFLVTDLTVKQIINLPPINEKISKITLSNIFKDILPYLNQEIKNCVMSSNISLIYEMYGIRKEYSLLHLFDKFIDERKNKIDYHLSIPNTKRDAFTQKLDDEIDGIKFLITKNLSKCYKCSEKIPSLTQCFHCSECFSIVCEKCKFDKNQCDICKDIYRGNTVDLYKLPEFNKNRSHCLMEILYSIKSRDKCPKKVLVYCSNEHLVLNLNRILENNNFWCLSLIGSTAQRLNKINKFKEVDTDIYMICNSIQNSAGIHLPETTDIIIYHELEDRYDTQVVGRAQRIGRKDSLYLHRIKHTVTE
jgi:hypothetical protein